MGITTRSLDGFRGLCHDLYVTKDWPTPAVRHVLAERFGVCVSERQFRRQLLAWGICKNTVNPAGKAAGLPVGGSEDTQALRERIRFCFRSLSMDDLETLAVLRGEGYSINLQQLQHLRHDMGLNLRATPHLTIDSPIATSPISLIDTGASTAQEDEEIRSPVLAQESMCDHLNLLGIPVAAGRVGFASMGCRQFGADGHNRHNLQRQGGEHTTSRKNLFAPTAVALRCFFAHLLNKRPKAVAMH